MKRCKLKINCTRYVRFEVHVLGKLGVKGMILVMTKISRNNIC